MEKTEETTSPAQQIAKILKARNSKNFSLVLGNLEIGRIVAQECTENGEDAIAQLAASLSAQGMRTTESFLFSTLRVYRSIGSERTLYAIRQKMGGNISWGFLLDNCTKVPEGNSREAQIYWEDFMAHIEGSLSDIEEMQQKRDSLPEAVKQQAEGLLLTACMPQNEDPRQPMEGDLMFANFNDVQMNEKAMYGKSYRYDPVTKLNVRAMDNARCISKAVDESIRRKCRFAQVPGDITESATPTPNEESLLRDQLQRLAEHMPVLIFPGNHDLPKNPYDHSSLEFLKGRPNIIVVEKPTILYLEGKEIRTAPSDTWPQKDCAKLFVLPFPQRMPATADTAKMTMAETNAMVSLQLEAILTTWASEIDERVPNLLFSHITVVEAEGVYDTMVEFDPAVHLAYLLPFDFVALGHIHKYQRIGDSEAYYIGSSDRFDFAEENQAKGFLITTMHGRKPESEFIDLPARKFATLEPEFFDDDGWKDKIDDETIYRVKGMVNKERYQMISRKLLEVTAGIVNNMTIEATTRTRDPKMTEALTDPEALQRFATEHLGIDDARFLEDLVRAFNTIVEEVAHQ